ncbi:sugar ABC transporter substrate-binding protein [Streptomyces sp. 7N604]|uniref:sugar ABC transporter substrate-binding protein n=1 Tax=Streptomyces sp. 7N604 TaxID=3457415 RepID=UPI003FD3DEAF
MKTRLRDITVGVAAVSLAVGLAACGKAAESGGMRASSPGGTGGGPKIGVLLPDSYTARWEAFDRPLIEKRIAERCSDCTVEYANARGDVATQQQQVDSMIIDGVEVMILDPVDSKALTSSVEKADGAGISVIAYDRLAEGPISAYVSFDGREVGRMQGEGLLQAMGDKADGGRIVMMNGPPADPNSAWFRDGALDALKGKVKIRKAYETVGWLPENAHTNMSGAIAALGPDGIDGVYSANDGLATGIVSSLKANNIKPLPPITGQDAELVGVQRIVKGEQYMSVYKPFKPQADAAAELAVALGRGEPLGAIAKDEVTVPDTGRVPAVLLTPVFVKADNIKETVVKDGMYTIEQICTPKYRSDCERVGLIP